MLKMRLSDTWPELLADAFSRPKYKRAKIHEALFQLDCRVVLTQNFDKIYDVYAQSETEGSTVIKNYYDDDTPLVMRRNYRSIIKVHGTIDEPSRTIFTRQDYAHVRNNYKSFHDLIDALFLTHTFLFVGCSFNDPDLRLFLEQHAYSRPKAPVHYMTSPDGEISTDLDSSIKMNMNIRLLRYSTDNGHSELTDSLRDLATQIDERRATLAETMDW
jgi:hypothetical protein